MTTKTLYDAITEAGIPTDSHESDLYIRATPEAAEILAQYPCAVTAKVFRSHVDGEWWWDVPFMYQPYWDAKAK